MHHRTPPDRRAWEKLWDGTVWEVEEHGHWSPLETRTGTPLVVVTAWNPGGMLLPVAVNQARDVVLRAELLALGLRARRARGRSRTGDWHEEGWQIPHADERTVGLLRRYGQLAGWISATAGASYRWVEPDPAT